jgi:tetratricopeptide (TPR) repeat protein
MPFTANVIRVLIASPSDLTEERKVAIETVYEWNAQHSEAESVVLLPVAWETHSSPRANVRPQQAINEQLVDKSDVLVGMFWTKLGTSTGVAESGTIEEIDRFVLAGKPALLYFSSRPIDPGAIDPKQNRRLKAFKDSTCKNALVGSFDSLDSLRQAISRHLLTEVRSLSLKNARATTRSAVSSAAQSPSEIAATEELSELPTEMWTRKNYDRSVFLAVKNQNDARIKLLDDAFTKTAEYSADDNRATWPAYIEWARILFGKGGQLKRLQKLAEEHADSAQTLKYLGRAYVSYEEHSLAASAFLSAMRVSQSKEVKADLAAKAVEQFNKAKDQKNVDGALATLRELAAGDSTLESTLTQAVYKLAEAEKADQLAIVLMEHYMALIPDDHSMRFELAFKQSNIGNEAIALHHYYQIPVGDRTSVVWNNIGAGADDLGLPAKSVVAYKRAAAMGNTLAMSNLGNKLMKSGFLELAREHCKTALEDATPHQNVGNLIASLASAEADEKLRQEEILDAVGSQLKYLRRLGQAATLETPKEIASEWRGPECLFKLTRNGNRISIRGQYESEGGGLVNALVPKTTGGLGSAAQISKTKHTISYVGQITGLAVVGEVKRERDGASILESAGERKALMILSDQADEITVIEQIHSESPLIYTLQRV